MSVHWSEDGAEVTKYGKSFKGTVTGMRPHNDGFKMSVFYNDNVVYLSEVVIFQMPLQGPAKYRMAIVRYDPLPGGGRVVSSVQGFEDVLCAVVR